MRHGSTICQAYPQFQLTNSTNTWSVALNTLPLSHHLLSQQLTQNQSGHCFCHPRVYVTAIGLLIPAGLGIFCCYFFWCWPARLVCWLLQQGFMWYTIVDDDVGQHPSTDVTARPYSLQDLMRIVTCIWNGNLHGWRVDGSNRHSH